MFLTFALMVLFAAIVVIFSQEFGGMFKKILAIKGAKLFLPLFAASWLVYSFDYWSVLIIYYCREMFHYALGFLVKIIPLGVFAKPISLIILLEAITILPVYLVDWHLRRKSYRGYQYPYLTSTFIFIVSAMLLLTL